VKSKPPRDRAASVRQRLLNLAKERGEEFNFVLLRYGLERLLYRLGQSRYAGTFVLKGAMLFPLWSGSAASPSAGAKPRAPAPCNVHKQNVR
jgi:hypothetical protein